jgi:hypothetical protein
VGASGLEEPDAVDARDPSEDDTSSPRDLTVTPETFDPTDPSKRPEGWPPSAASAWWSRVKGQVDRLAGMTEDTSRPCTTTGS